MDDRVMAALDAAVRGIAGVLDLERLLQLIVDEVRELANAEYAALGIVDEAGVIQRFVTSGLTEAERERIGDLPQGKGLLGLIIREKRSFRIHDIGTDPRRHGFPPNHPPMSSFLGVPITLHGKSVGRLYLTNKRGAPEFTAHDQSIVERFALHAAIAMENARLHEAERRLAVVDDRERIGRDMHDGTIQNLYAVTLMLDDVPALMEEDPAQARERVDRAVDSLHGVIRDIRSFIFGLRPILLEDGGLSEELESLAAELEAGAGIEVRVRVDEELDLPPGVVAELLAIAREALSNVARHARASHVSLDLERTADAVRLTVEDDGIGFDAVAARPRTHQGLDNLQARAARLGGDVRIDSGAGRGTRIMLTLPLTTSKASQRRAGGDPA